MALNWITTTEIPFWDNKLITSSTFILELLPQGDTISEIRKIRPICLKCDSSSSKRLLPLRTQFNYKSTTNYISHL